MSDAQTPAPRLTPDARIAVNRTVFIDACRAKGCRTDDQIADLLGTNRRMVQRYRDGVVAPRLPRARDIADRLGVHVDDLWPRIPATAA